MSDDEMVAAMRERYTALSDRISAGEMRLESVRDVLLARLERTRTELGLEITDTRDVLRAEITQSRAEAQVGIAEVRAEIRESRAEIMAALGHLIDVFTVHISDGHGGQAQAS